jgi:hypothetical protein
MTTVILSNAATQNATGLVWDNGTTVTLDANATANGTNVSLLYAPGVSFGHMTGLFRSNDLFTWTYHDPVTPNYYDQFTSFMRPTRISAGNWVGFSDTALYSGGERQFQSGGDSKFDANGFHSLAGVWSSTDGLLFTRPMPRTVGSPIPTIVDVGTIIPHFAPTWDSVTIAGQKWIPVYEDARSVLITNANPAVVTKTRHGLSAGSTINFTTGEFGLTTTGDMVTGSPIVTNVVTTSAAAGMAVNFAGGIRQTRYNVPLPLTGFPAGTTVVSVGPGNQLTMSVPSTVTATQNLLYISTLPQPIMPGVTYYVKTVLSADTFTISATNGGTAIDTTGAVQCFNTWGYPCILVPDGGNHVSRVAVDNNYNTLTSPAPVRMGSYSGVQGSPGGLNASGSYLEDGIMHYYATRGFFTSTANFGWQNYSTYNSGNGPLQRELIDRYCEVVDATAAAQAAPIGVKISAAAGAVTLKWDNCLPNNTYRIYRGGPAAQTTFVADVTGTTYTDNGVPVGLVQYYKVVTMQSGVERQSRVVSSYVSSSSAFVNKHITRVIADGGDFGTCNRSKLDDAYNWLVANTLLNTVTRWIDPGFCVKQDASNVITKIYDLGTTRNPKQNDVWFCSGNPCTGASGTTFAPTGMNGNTEAWVNGAANAFGIFGGLLDANNMNGRLNTIRQTTEISIFASYIKGSSGTDITLYGQAEFAPGTMSLQHLSGTPGTASFILSDDVGDHTATANFTGTATAPHTIGGTFGSTGNLFAYADGVQGSADTGLHTNTDGVGNYSGPLTMALPTTLVGQLGDTTTTPFGVMGSKRSRFTYATPSTYGQLDSQAAYTGGDFIIFEKELTSTQMASLHTLVSGWVSPVVAAGSPSVTITSAPYSATCNGSADDSAAFTAWNTAAVTWDAANPSVPGDIVLTIPNSKCMFLQGGSSIAIAKGILNHRVRVVGAGASSEFSDNGTGGGWTFGTPTLIDDNAHDVRIAAASRGATSITINSLTNCASLWVPGQWAVITGFDMEGMGQPPNMAFWDYVKISAVNCGTGVVTFATTPLTHDYKTTWPVNYAGSGIALDQGGPGTIYQIDPTWPLTVEVNNLKLTINNPSAEGQANPGKDITFKNVTVATTDVNRATCAVPTMNMSFRVINSNYSDCNIEVDKMIDYMLWENVTMHAMDFQTPSVKEAVFSKFDPSSFLTGAGVNTFIASSTLPSWGTGPHAYGAATGKLYLVNNNIAGVVLTSAGTSGATGVNGLGTWSGNAYTIARSDIPALEGGLTVLTWAVPGANIYFQGGNGSQGPTLQVTDVAESGSNIVVSFNQNGIPLSGGFPTMPANSGVVHIKAHPLPQLIASGNYGSAWAIDLNQTPPGKPIGSYSKVQVRGANGSYATAATPPIVNGGFASPYTMTVWGKMVGVNVTVDTAYTGSNVATLGFGLGQFAPGFQTLGSSSLSSWPFVPNSTVTVDAKTAGLRFLGPTSVSGSRGADTLASPSGAANTWFLLDQNTGVYSSIPGDIGSTSTTVEVITDQGVVNSPN